MTGLIAVMILIAFQSVSEAPATGSVTAPVAPATIDVNGKPWPPPGVHRRGEGVVLPQPTKWAKPMYTSAAMYAKVTGDVHLEAIVKTNGRVSEVRITRSLDPVYGLDEQAVKAVKEMRFKPGTKDGVPVPVLINFILTFTMK